VNHKQSIICELGYRVAEEREEDERKFREGLQIGQLRKLILI